MSMMSNGYGVVGNGNVGPMVPQQPVPLTSANGVAVLITLTSPARGASGAGPVVPVQVWRRRTIIVPIRRSPNIAQLLPFDGTWPGRAVVTPVEGELVNLVVGASYATFVEAGLVNLGLPLIWLTGPGGGQLVLPVVASGPMSIVIAGLPPGVPQS